MDDPILQAQTEGFLFQLMVFLYSIAIRAYGLFILFASFFNPKAKQWISGRKNQKWTPAPADRPVIWFHCASLGEFDQGLPVMEEWKTQHPESYILVTFFSPSGMLHYHKRSHPADQVIYLDLDTHRNAERFIHFFKPDRAFFVKYEFWPNHIRSAKGFGTKLYSISTLLRQEQVYFKPYGRFFAETLNMFDFFFVQNEETRDLLGSIRIKNVSVTGDNRFDQVIKNARNNAVDPKILAFKKQTPIFIIGSSWPVDEKVLIPFVNSVSWKVIIAPHQIDRRHIERLKEEITRKCCCYTEFAATEHQDHDVLILDTIGHLSSAYSVGDIAYVGGGFTGKLHNILEPAVFGLPILFGPKHDRFPEASYFLKEGIAFEINSETALQEQFSIISSKLPAIRQKAMTTVEQNAGASRRIVQHLNASSTI